MHKLGVGAATRAISLIAVGAAIVTTELHFHRGKMAPANPPDALAAEHTDPLTHELIRCQAIGMRAKDDAACEAAWAENRRRFFAPIEDKAFAPSPDARPPR